MGNIFDILPPQARQEEVKPALRKNSNGGGCFLLFVIIVLVLILGINYYPEKFNLYSTPTASPSNSSKNTKDFDLFNNELGTDVKQTDKIKVRIINASGKVEEINHMKNILSDAGFQIEQTTVTDTTYNQTMIYYRTDDKTKAEQVQDALTTTYNTKIEESLSLSTSYDILVIIGQNQVN